MTDNAYINERLDEQQRWHSDKSRKCQCYYKWLSGIEAGCIALIPVVILVPCFDYYSKFAVAVLGAVASLLKYIKHNNSYHELWIKYRLISEALKKEKYLYQTGTGIYKNKDNKTKYCILAENTEAILDKGNIKWEAITSIQESYAGPSQGS